MGQARLNAPARTDRPCCSADVSTNGDVAAQRERAHGVFRVEDNDKVGDVGADLEAPPETACGDA